jgi:hypothetical protein
MAFFRNGAVNRVYLHAAVQALAQGAGQLFFFVFLLRAGVSVPMTLMAQAAIVVGRFALRPALIPLAVRWGLKPVLVAGTLAMAVQYPLLAYVRGLDATLLLLVAVTAAAEVFYWASYNGYFAAVGDAEHRGHQIAATQAVTAVAGIAAPLLAGGSLAALGPKWTFAAVGLVQAAAVLPLLGAPNVAVPARAPGMVRAAWRGALAIAFDGWFDTFYRLAWQIALFLVLKESFAAYGGAMALAGLAGAAGGLVLGPHIDRGGGRRATLIAYGATAAIVAVRAASLAAPWLAVAGNALGEMLMPLIVPALGTVLYNLAKASPCPLRFQLGTEGGWDVGCFLASLTGAGLLWAGAPLWLLILLALPACAASVTLLWRLYPAAGVGAGDPAVSQS